jgi:hypothetical protein
MSDPRTPGFTIEPRNKFFSAIASISQYELRYPGNTVTFLHEVDLTEVEAARARAAQGGGAKPSYTAFVIKAVALAVREFPYANRRATRFGLFGPRVQRFDRVDAAVLCERELPDAPMVAFVDMIRDADGLSLGELNEKLRALALCDTSNNEQWGSFVKIIRRLPSWLANLVIRLPVLSPRLWARYRGGAFVISSPAKYGVDVVTAMWPWPLGVSFGLVKPRPVVVDGRVVARPTFVLTLNFDRRIMAGAQGARFFKRVVDLLEAGCADAPRAAPAPAAEEKVPGGVPSRDIAHPV